VSKFRVNVERRLVQRGWVDVEAEDEGEAKLKAKNMLAADEVYLGDPRREEHVEIRK
jgi:hypothetical protein